MQTKLSLLGLVLLMGLAANTGRAEITYEFTWSTGPGPNSTNITAYLEKGMQYARFRSPGALGNLQTDPGAFTVIGSSKDFVHKDILKWIYIALHTNGVEGLSGHCFAKIRDSVAKHHPREFLFAIDSDDAPDSLRFAGNVATNVANGQELSFSPTTFFGGEYGAGGVTNTYTSGQLVPVNEIIVHYRVFFKYSDAASRATIESYILINDPFRLSCAMRHAATAIGDSFAVSTAPAMVMSRVNTGTNILPVFTLVGQPSLYASYTVLWAGPLPNSPAAWELFQEQLPDGYSRSFTNVGPKFFKSLRGPAQQGGFAKQVVGLVPSVGFSQTD